MKPDFTIGPYDPCPCGSGAKYKWCCAAKAREHLHGRFPIGTVAFYGPDDKTATKITVGVLMSEEDDDPRGGGGLRRRRRLPLLPILGGQARLGGGRGGLRREREVARL